MIPDGFHMIPGGFHVDSMWTSGVLPSSYQSNLLNKLKHLIEARCQDTW
jgi:hypothetical protein